MVWLCCTGRLKKLFFITTRLGGACEPSDDRSKACALRSRATFCSVSCKGRIVLEGVRSREVLSPLNFYVCDNGVYSALTGTGILPADESVGPAITF